MIRAVVLDAGETLFSEERAWADWPEAARADVRADDLHAVADRLLATAATRSPRRHTPLPPIE